MCMGRKSYVRDSRGVVDVWGDCVLYAETLFYPLHIHLRKATVIFAETLVNTRRSTRVTPDSRRSLNYNRRTRMNSLHFKKLHFTTVGHNL
jgi:hypothetical protein